MSAVPDDVLNEKLGGIQLALFELIWPSFTWIGCIYMAVSPGTCSVHVQADEVQSDVEWDDCVRLLVEVFEPYLDGSKTQLDLVCSTSPPVGAAFKEVMSQAIFEMIAKEVAPWRLDAGR